MCKDNAMELNVSLQLGINFNLFVFYSFLFYLQGIFSSFHKMNRMHIKQAGKLLLPSMKADGLPACCFPALFKQFHYFIIILLRTTYAVFRSAVP